MATSRSGIFLRWRLPGPKLIEVVAIYSNIELDHPGRWLARVLPHVSACVGWERGGYAHAYDLRGAPERWGLSMPVAHDLSSEVASTVMSCFAVSPHEERRHLYLDAGPAGTFSEHAPRSTAWPEKLGRANGSACATARTSTRRTASAYRARCRWFDRPAREAPRPCRACSTPYRVGQP